MPEIIEYELLFGPELFSGRMRPPSREALERMLNASVPDAKFSPCQKNSSGSLAHKTFNEIQQAAESCARNLRALGELSKEG